MQRSRQGLLGLVPVALALALVAGCSSSNKNNNKNVTNTANQAANVAANTAASASPAPIRTATPLVTATRTPTPAAAGIAARTPTPSTGVAVPGLAPNTAAADASLQSALAGAALTLSDLPAGYTAASAPDTSRPMPGQTAGYTADYVNLSLPNVGLIVDGLVGFTDTSAAQSAFGNLQSTLQSLNAASNLKLSPVSGAPKIGDDTQVFTTSLTVQGTNLSGYVVAWRRGRLGGEIVLAGLGTAAPTSPNDAIALAQKQDANLQKVQQ